MNRQLLSRLAPLLAILPFTSTSLAARGDKGGERFASAPGLVIQNVKTLYNAQRCLNNDVDFKMFTFDAMNASTPAITRGRLSLVARTDFTTVVWPNRQELRGRKEGNK